MEWKSLERYDYFDSEISQLIINGLSSSFALIDIDKFHNYPKEIQRDSKIKIQKILEEFLFLENKSAKALENVYPGSRGCAQTAGIKIQLEYDLHSGEFLNFQVGPGKNNDKTFGTECLDTLWSGDLCIRDLDYFYWKT